MSCHRGNPPPAGRIPPSFSERAIAIARRVRRRKIDPDGLPDVSRAAIGRHFRPTPAGEVGPAQAHISSAPAGAGRWAACTGGYRRPANIGLALRATRLISGMREPRWNGRLDARIAGREERESERGLDFPRRILSRVAHGRDRRPFHRLSHPALVSGLGGVPELYFVIARVLHGFYRVFRISRTCYFFTIPPAHKLITAQEKNLLRAVSYHCQRFGRSTFREQLPKDV